MTSTNRLLLLVATASCLFAATTFSKDAAAPANRYGFRPNVKLSVDGDTLVVKSDGIPDHTTGDFPNRNNPNTIRKQDYTFRIPLHPRRADRVSPLPMGPIGVAVNGVPFYNPYNAEGQDAAKNEVFDECCGHPDPMGRYHYHIYPKCIHTSFSDPKGQHSPLIGYAFDGYALYGPNGENGKPPADLDECNGHTDATRGYHYHVTDKFPYLLGGYRGEVDRGNFDGPGLRTRMFPGGVDGGPPIGGLPRPDRGGHRPPPPPPPNF